MRAEREAARYLQPLGYRILARNQQNRFGEIDLLAWESSTLVIIEVRSSENQSFQQIAATVNLSKQRKLTRAAHLYVQRHRLKNVAIRFDVVVVRWPATGKPQFQLFRNAFPAIGSYQFGG